MRNRLEMVTSSKVANVATFRIIRSVKGIMISNDYNEWSLCEKTGLRA